MKPYYLAGYRSSEYTSTVRTMSSWLRLISWTCVYARTRMNRLIAHMTTSSRHDPKWEWQYQAKCREDEHREAAERFGVKAPTELWFPPRNRDIYGPMANYAKGICKGTKDRPPCPVRFDCLQAAVENDEEHGIFGGFSHRERNALIRKLARSQLTILDYCKAKGMP